MLISRAIVCPNDECERLSLSVAVDVYTKGNFWKTEKDFHLLPRSNAKPTPDYVPEAIRKNYEEACLVLADSPNASASLARRCLQGMIHDVFDIRERTLKDEIDALEQELNPLVWNAIEKVRKLGNIGAHMEKDVNLIIDVERHEAEQLIELIELLINDWYVVRHQREERLKSIGEIPTDKKDRAGKNQQSDGDETPDEEEQEES
jgi:hypothetical protein